MIDAPHSLTATQAARAMSEGHLTSEDLIEACLARIQETDDAIVAWAHLDADHARAQASECDRIRKAGLATGALHGVPVGLKDIVDTVDMPTGHGSPIFAGHQPESDARIVELLRDAGAVIMGKTVTTELAFMNPSVTRNPHNPDRTPGGSSSGSAAAVAAQHVPIAVGTQTNGSVIRPASFCGTVGFKPTRGVISRTGILQTSRSLDQVGCFGRSLEDVALLTDVIGGYDQRDTTSFARPRPNMCAGAVADTPDPPDIAWIELPFYDRLAEDARSGLDLVLGELDPQVTRVGAADPLANLVAAQKCIHEHEISQQQAPVFDANWDQLSDTLKAAVKRGRETSAIEYEDALVAKASAEAYFAEFFTEFDAIIAPSAAGEAPPFGDGTGDPVFCTVWTFAGLPAVTLPLLAGGNGLPIGVQLIGPAERDDQLLRTARWLQDQLASESEWKWTR